MRQQFWRTMKALDLPTTTHLQCDRQAGAAIERAFIMHGPSLQARTTDQGQGQVRLCLDRPRCQDQVPFVRIMLLIWEYLTIKHLLSQRTSRISSYKHGGGCSGKRFSSMK